MLHDTDIGRTRLNLYRDAGGEAIAGDGSHADAVADDDESFPGGKGAGPGEAAFRGAHIRSSGLVGAWVLGLRGGRRRDGELGDRFGGRDLLLLFRGLVRRRFGQRLAGFRRDGGLRGWLDGDGGGWGGRRGGSGSSHLGGVLAGEEVTGNGEAEGEKKDGAGHVATFGRWLRKLFCFRWLLVYIGNDSGSCGAVVQSGVEVGDELGTGVKASSGILGEGAAEDPGRRFADFGVDLGCGGGIDGEDLVDEAGEGIRGEGAAAGEEFEGDDGEGELVGPAGEGFGKDLLGGHVGGGADGRAGHGHGGCFEDFGDAEIGDFGVAGGGDEDVGRFDVAVDNPFGMSEIEAGGNFAEDLEEAGPRKGALGHDRVERGAVDVFHDEEGKVVFFGEFVDGDDVGVVEGSGGLGFAGEAGFEFLAGGGVAKFLGEDGFMATARFILRSRPR